jgi:hypothetical protein
VVGPAEWPTNQRSTVDDGTVHEKFLGVGARQPGATRRDIIAGVAAATGLKRNDVLFRDSSEPRPKPRRDSCTKLLRLTIQPWFVRPTKRDRL